MFPEMVADTVPLLAMVTFLAFAGTVTPLATARPPAVTRRPWLSTWNDPSRVYWVLPSGMVTWKKPLPWMAASSGLPVCCRVPWANERLVATVRTPRPRCRPVGSCDCSVVLEPTWRRFWYIRSSNTALARL